MTLIEALKMLDKDNAEHWTKEGLAVLAILENLTGAKVSRLDIPKGFNRYTCQGFAFTEAAPAPAPAPAEKQAPTPDQPTSEAPVTLQGRLAAVQAELATVEAQLAPLNEQRLGLIAQSIELSAAIEKQNTQTSMSELISRILP